MNFKKERGVTLIILVICILVIATLLLVTIDIGTDSIKRAKLEDIKTDMISIKTKAKIIVEQYNFKDIEGLVGTQITQEEAQKLGIVSNAQTCKWSSSDLSAQGLTSVEGDTYIVQYDLENPSNSEVYYLEGYEGKYSLSELKDL